MIHIFLETATPTPEKETNEVQTWHSMTILS